MSEQIEESKAETFEYIFQDEEDVQNALAAMQSMIDTFQVVSVADFKDLVGVVPTHEDNNVGWTNLDGVKTVLTDEGFHALVLSKPAVLVYDAVADIVAGVEKAAAIEENREQAQVKEDTFGAKLDRIESKLDELLARGT